MLLNHCGISWSWALGGFPICRITQAIHPPGLLSPLLFRRLQSKEVHGGPEMSWSNDRYPRHLRTTHGAKSDQLSSSLEWRLVGVAIYPNSQKKSDMVISHSFLLVYQRVPRSTHQLWVFVGWLLKGYWLVHIRSAQRVASMTSPMVENLGKIIAVTLVKASTVWCFFV